ncbi:hypothetical protein RDI86_02010 [Cellulosimicrobium sp. XJ-DQ-B-000]|uniref:hypothetical protein n=1 Tax=Cellulosimicrobium sp. XJ-DQ-B-000 TaxID=3072182 RepID=UPI002807FB47|nr:hypothetical protein [Cellulosimicrobium sp. XJ-DQ-B-000]MDQ8040622.1 hypothetical protein [Cellulosimicrobium sp. XJ-DQ-B-000]
MSTARDYLAAVQQRADAATDGPWTKDPDEPSIVLKPDAPGGWDGTAIATVQRDDYGLVEEANTEFIAASRTDVPRLVAALTAALDLADDPQRHKVALGHVDRDDLLAVITDALTPKENDS